MGKRILFLLIMIGAGLLFAREDLKADWTYTVKRGDTIYKIARRTGTTVTAIRRRNGFYGRILRPGKRLIIPTAPTRNGWVYTVRRGDTIYRISRRVGVPVSRIRSANGLYTNSLRIGQRIFIPTAATGKSTTARMGNRRAVNAYALAQLIHAEAEAEPFAGKVAVGAVVLNRIENPKFPNTLAGVLYQPHAFETVSNGRIYNRPSRDALRAAQAAISGWDPSGGAIYFFNPSKTRNRFIWSRRIINRIGKHIFSI